MHKILGGRAGSAPFVRNPTLAAWGKRRTSLSHPALRRCAICTQSPLRGSFSHIYASSPHAASVGFPTICASPKRRTHRHIPTDTHRGARGAPTHTHPHRGTREATPTHTSTHRGVQRRAGSAPFVRSPTLAAWGKRQTSLSHPALRRCAEGGGKKSSRSGNESFLTYFRFLSSHTTVRAVRHTAV